MTQSKSELSLDEMDIPSWIKKLVPVAMRTRVIVFTSVRQMLALSLIAAGVVAARGFGWISYTFAAVIGLLFAVRYSGEQAEKHAARMPHLPYAGQPLPPGGRVWAIILAADLICSMLGFIVLVPALVAHSEHPLAGAGLMASIALFVVVSGAAGAELPIRRRLAACVAGCLCAALICLGGLLLWLGRGGQVWWALLCLVIAIDVAGYGALRLGRSRDTREYA